MDLTLRFVESPDLSTVTGEELEATIESLATINESADISIKPYIEAIIEPLEHLLDVSQGNPDVGVDFSNFKASTLELTNRCKTDVAPAEPTDTAPTGSDLTSQLKSAAGDAVISATETEPGRIEIQTSIVDPRGEDGGQEAREAIAICNAAVALGAAKVVVFEADGSTFVLYGHPSHGNQCTEV